MFTLRRTFPLIWGSFQILPLGAAREFRKANSARGRGRGNAGGTNDKAVTRSERQINGEFPPLPFHTIFFLHEDTTFRERLFRVFDTARCLLLSNNAALSNSASA